MRYALRLLVLACLAVAPLVPAKAADLRITFEELTDVVRVIAGDSKIFLNNAPSGPIAGLFTSQSQMTILGKNYPLPVQPREFRVVSSTYVYYINDISSTSLRVVPIRGGLQLALTFEEEGLELVSRCLSGPCTLRRVLPQVEWAGAGATIDLVPVQFNGSVAMRAKQVRISGTPRAVCQGEAGFLPMSFCRAGIRWANQAIERMRPDIENAIRDEINKPDIQQQLADQLKVFLTLGPAGVIKINSLALDPASMTVRFNFAASGG